MIIYCIFIYTQEKIDNNKVRDVCELRNKNTHFFIYHKIQFNVSSIPAINELFHHLFRTIAHNTYWKRREKNWGVYYIPFLPFSFTHTYNFLCTLTHIIDLQYDFYSSLLIHILHYSWNGKDAVWGILKIWNKGNLWYDSHSFFIVLLHTLQHKEMKKK